MTDYQKDRINSMMRDAWETYCRHSDAMKDKYLSERQVRRHADRMYELIGLLNGMRETLLVLGYSVRYEDGSYPQVV